MSKPSLRDRSKTDLANLARKKGVRGFERMSKDQLIKALGKVLAATPARPVKVAATSRVKPTARATTPIRGSAAKPTSKPSTNGTHAHTNGASKGHPAPQVAPKPAAKLTTPPKSNPAPAKPSVPAGKTVPSKPIAAPAAKVAPSPGKSTKPVAPVVPPKPEIPAEKDLSSRSAKGAVVKDRIILSAPDAYWLHAFWELSQQSVLRAEAALGQDWHGARPILRLFDVTSQDTTSTSEAPVRDIVIHGGSSRWYIDVPQPPRSYRVDIGYLTRNGRFFPLCRSNVQTPPVSGASETLEESWGESDNRTSPPNRDGNEDPFRRPMKDTAFGTGAVLPGKLKKFFFDIDAELIVYGKTDPTAGVTLQNEPVKLRPDGTFTMRFSLPDSRQIIPAVATSTDGMEEQTIVLAVERNTKRLDPMIHDLYGEN